MPKAQKSCLERVGHWARLKQYQFEVTFAINVYTPSEKIFFWSVFLFLVSLSLYATLLYVPRNLFYVTKHTLTFLLGEQRHQQEMGKLLSAAASSSVSASANEIVSIPEAVIHSSAGLPIH